MLVIYGTTNVNSSTTLDPTGRSKQELADLAVRVSVASEEEEIAVQEEEVSEPEVKPFFVGEKITMGGLSDSAYEYMLKQYILDGKKDKELLQMYIDAMQGMRDLLLYQAIPSAAPSMQSTVIVCLLVIAIDLGLSITEAHGI